MLPARDLWQEEQFHGRASSRQYGALLQRDSEIDVRVVVDALVLTSVRNSQESVEDRVHSEPLRDHFGLQVFDPLPKIAVAHGRLHRHGCTRGEPGPNPALHLHSFGASLISGKRACVQRAA